MVRIYTTLVLAIACIMFGSHMSYAEQSKADFIIEATIILPDGQALEVADFRFYGQHERPNFYARGQTYHWSPGGLMVARGNYWEIIQIDKIQKLLCSRESKRPVWLMANITLTSGETITGKISKYPSDTWISGDWFQVRGKAIVLGAEGDFLTHIAAVKSLARSADKTNLYLLEDTEGKTTTLRNVSFWAYGPERHHVVSSYSYKGNSPIRVKVGKTEVSLKLKDIDNLVFLKGKVKIKMKSGEEAVGTLSSITRVYARLNTGQIFFRDLSKGGKLNLKSIHFR